MWLDTSVLSTAASASDRGVQIESADRDDVAFHRLRISRLHQERNHGQVSPGFYSTDLSLGLAGAAALLLGLSEYALVSIHFLKAATMNSDPAIRITMLPRDTNSQGTIFGGVILSYIDMAGAIEAHRRTGMDRFVTVAMREVIFHAPVFVGDLVSFYSETIKIGKTSITTRVVVEAERYGEPGEKARVTQAEVVYVAVDRQGTKMAIKTS